MKTNSTKSRILAIILATTFANISFAQTWPCAQYITRQVPNGSSYMTNISYVYDLGVVPVTVTVAKIDTLLNASAIYNGNIWAWKQYTGTAESGSGGARLIKVNYNGLDSTVTPTLTGYSFPTITMACNAGFIDPNGIYYVIDTATSGASYFVLSRINLTTATPTLLSNLKVNLPSGSTVSSGGLGDFVYRNDSVFALVNNSGLFRFALPSTSTTSVSPNLVGGTINRTIGSLFAFNSDLNNIYGYGSANGATTQDRLLEISTQSGVVTELTLSGVSVSQSDGAGCPSTNFSPPIFLNISGTVYDDANGLYGSPANTIGGTSTNAGGTLYAQLLDGTNAVEETIPVASNGTYSFTGLTPGTYTVLIDNSPTASTATTLPSNWVNTGEFNAVTAGSAGSDGNINGKSASITLALANVANVEFGIEQLPTANNVTAASQVNPGGTTQVTVPILNGSDPEQGTFPGTGNLDTVIINTLPTNGTLYYNNVAIPVGDTIKNYNPSLLTIDPNSGAITVSFTYSEVDGALKSSSAATVSMLFTTVGVSGNVFDDANGLTDNTVNGTGTNAGSLNAVLINTSTGKTVAITTVATNGTYSFTGLDGGSSYTVEITTNTATVGTTAPAVALPTGWLSTGENLGTGIGNDGTINGILSVGTVSTNITNADFGIEQPPTANNVTAASQVNPGGTTQVTVPTLNGSDPEQGTFPGTGNLDTVIINTLPTNGTLYYNNVTIPVGDTIKNYNPSLLTIDPNSGAITVSFTYSEVDGALKSSSAATVSMLFTTVGVSGNVFDDANGLTDNTVNGTGTNAGSLNAVLINTSTGKTAAITTVATNGTYSFTGLDGGSSYTVEITTNTATIGATAPAVALPTGWLSTGENIGTGAGNDGTINSVLSLGTVSTNITNADFGIEQPPTANDVTAVSQVNPGAGNKVTVPTLNGADAEQGTFPGTGNLDTVIINILPSNGTLYYNNVAIPAGDTIKNYNPSLLAVSPNSGSVTISFAYSEVDAALKSSAPAIITMPFTTVGISGNVFDDANGLTDNTVNGTGTNAGSLNAVLINTSTGKTAAITTVATNGTYSFTGLDGGSNYTVEITTNTATIGTIAPGAVLPTGWVSTGENLGAGTGNDGIVNSILPIGTVSINITNADFGIEQSPTANNVAAASQVNPGGTTQVTVPTLNGSDPEQGIFPGTDNLDTVIINTLPTNGTLYYNNVAIPVGDTIKNYNPSLLTVDPNSGGVIISFTYSEIDGALKSSVPATVSVPFSAVSISGNVFDDANGLTDNTVNGTGTNAGGLNAVLINATTGNTLAVATIAANGTYSFSGLNEGNYIVAVTANNATIGTTAPAVALPIGWVSTGENLGAGTGNDGIVNSILPIGTVSTNITNADFGIEQSPTANNVAAASQVNPGGTTQVTVPTLNGSDPEQGILPGTDNQDTVIINTLPTNGILYYNNVAIPAGDTIENYNPSLLMVGPNSGAIIVNFTYSEVDAALNSSTPATVSMPFTAVSISGNVFDDANGLTDNTVNGTGTNAGGLNAILINATTGNTLAVATIAANGTYSFSGLNEGNYIVAVTANNATIGTTAPAVALPTGWVSTGENLGGGVGNDGIVNSILSIGTVSTNITNADFGIEQSPTANNVAAASQVNPGGTTQVTVPTLNGSDPEQGILPGTDNQDTVIINTLPTNGTLYYNNVAIPAGDTIENYNPSLLMVGPNSGAIIVNFTYSEVDAALNSSTPATVSMPFTAVSISGNVFDDANGLTDNTVNGTGTNAGGLNAILINAATGNTSAVAVVAANGSYSFSGVNEGNYMVEITTNTATVGTAAPGVVLPAGWVSTGENLGAGAGSDGKVDGILPIGIISTTTINADFGIEQLPTSDNKTYDIVSPSLNSSITLDGSIGAPGPLSGSDPEDGILGSAKTVVITAVPTNSLLYYNGVVVTNNTTITNYDPSQLVVKFTTPGSMNTSFHYAFVDAAGNQDLTSATYFISWASTLPVVLTNFTAQKENDYSVLNWSTSSELNVKVFNVERSTDDGKTWEPIGEVIAKGNATEAETYSFTDDNPEAGTDLYRLQVEDNDGTLTYSSISEVEVEAESSMKVYPNPVGQEEALNIELAGLKAGSYQISFVSSSGQIVKQMTFVISNSGAATLVIPTGNIARGSYEVIVRGDTQQFSKTVIVANR